MATEPRQPQGVVERLQRLSRRLPPGISQRLDEQFETVLERVDRWNRSLAEYSIPRDRKDRVSRRARARGKPGAGRLRVVPRDPE